MSGRPVRLEPSFREKIWGSTALRPWFSDSPKKIGEVWFSREQDVPLLLKFIFTTERLSVQVHPEDDYAARIENSAGKTEMWHILRADPGSAIALGFKEPLTPERLKEASRTGEIEHLLNWVTVQQGETYFVCAGMVHAIGAGIALAEIQQFSDITYRLFDFGRPRELHLNKAADVTRMHPHPGAAVPLPAATGIERLIACRYFVTDRVTVSGSLDLAAGGDRPEFWMITQGSATVSGERLAAGEVWFVEPASYQLSGEAILLRTFVP
jgi:mannose-6-phosphate isomerase